MARRVARSAPIRTMGTLLINPRKRKSNPRKKAASTTATTTSRRRRRRKPAARGAGTLRIKLRTVNPRKRRAVKRRSSARRRRVNPRAKRARVRASRPTYFRKRRASRKKNGYHRKRKLNPRRRRRNGAKMRKAASGLRKIPFIGAPLAAAVGLVPSAIFGALVVEPMIMVSQLIARYIPAVPSSAVYAVGGLVLGGLVHEFMPFVKPSTRRDLAIASATAGSAIAFYKVRTGTDMAVADEMGTLLIQGLGNPVVNALQGADGMGELLALSGAPVYGEAGPMAVYPMGAAGTYAR